MIVWKTEEYHKGIRVFFSLAEARLMVQFIEEARISKRFPNELHIAKICKDGMVRELAESKG